jgi:mRNA interferase RelE/StbE
MYEVKLSSFASKFYFNANSGITKKLTKCFEYLEKNPYKSNNIKRLSGRLENFFRFRIGEYRVIYSVNENKKVVEIFSIKHRKDAYK